MVMALLQNYIIKTKIGVDGFVELLHIRASDSTESLTRSIWNSDISKTKQPEMNPNDNAEYPSVAIVNNTTTINNKSDTNVCSSKRCGILFLH